MSNDQIAPSDSTLQGQYAGFVTRFSAILVDLLLVIAVMIIVGASVVFLMRFFNIYDFFQGLIDSLSQRYAVFQTIFRLVAALGTFYFVFFIYYVSLHTIAGGVTMGKALMGVRVVRMDGTLLTLGRCTRRYLTFLLSALPLFLGLLWVIIDDRRQGWHDKLSDTCVIYDWPAQEDESFLSGLKSRLRYASETRDRGANSEADNSSDAQPGATAAPSESLT